jgi:hypothetical protein
LDVATADRLLFYAPIDEPPEWRRQRESGAMARPLFDFYDQIRYSCRSHDPGTTEHSLAVSLGIGIEELPVIIVTTDPRSNEYLALRTSKEYVRRQLLMLAELSQEIPSIRDRRDQPRTDWLTPHELRRRGLDLCDGAFTPEMSESLAGVLHQVLSLSLTRERDRGTALYAQASCREALDQLHRKIGHARLAVRALGEGGPDPGEEERIGKLFTLHEQLATYVAQLSDQESQQDSPDRRAPEGWDPESIQWVRLGDRVRATLGDRSGTLVACPDPTDFSPAAVCWSKAFEAELNHSLGHWVRQILGVCLPPYYGKYQEGVRAVFTGGDGRFSVDFNRRRHPGHAAWSPPELGALQGPVAYYMKHHPVQPLPAKKWKLLAEKWDAIRRVRNDVCHPYQVNQDRAKLIREAIRALRDDSVLQGLASLKGRLRGCAPESEPPAGTGGRARWWRFWK